MRVEEPARRASLLALSALATAFAAATANLFVFELLYRLGRQPMFADPDEYGEMSAWASIWGWWTDAIAFSIALGGGALGFLASLLLLWRTDLSKSIPAVFTVTVVVAALTGSVGPLLGVTTSLVCAIGAMAWCQRRFTMVHDAPGVTT